jgi:hypothetical protein
MEPRNRNSEEIDLLYFFNPLLRGFRKVGAGINRYVNRLQRNLALFIVIFLVVAGAAFALRYILPKMYSTEAVFGSNILPASFCSEMINNLGSLLDKENVPIIAQQLNISQAASASIRSISTVKMSNIVLIGRSDSNVSAFRVRLVVSDQNMIPEIQKGLEHYLENNDFALRRKDARRKTLEDLRTDLVARINNLDSLKNILSRSMEPRSSGQGIILGEPVSPIQAYQVQRDYFRQLKEIEESLSLLRNVEVVQPFFKLNEPNAPNFQKIFLYGLVLGLIAALIITPVVGRR